LLATNESYPKHVLRTRTVLSDLAALRDCCKSKTNISEKLINVSGKSDYRSFHRSADMAQISRRHAADNGFFQYRFD